MARTDGPDDEHPDRKDYKVGYKRPPMEHCFRPGQSGNPTGKRKMRATTESVTDIVVREAYRMVQLREGDKIISLPAIQAAMRSHMISAAKGDQKALTHAYALIHRIERERQDEWFALFKTAIDYKAEMKKELTRREREGILAPDPVPHPDDIIIDHRRRALSRLGALLMSASSR